MKRLILVQHARARPREEGAERPLSDTGQADIRRVASFLADHGVRPDRIMHSGKLRARQTAEVLAHRLACVVEAVPDLDPMADPGIWFAHLEAIEREVMLVGHMPHIGRLTSLLLTRYPDRVAVRFVPGTVVCLQREDGLWQLAWMLTPGLLA